MGNLSKYLQNIASYFARTITDELESDPVRIGQRCEHTPPPRHYLDNTQSCIRWLTGDWWISNLLDIEADQKVERDFVHVPPGVDTDQFKPLPVVGVLHQHVPVEEAHEVVEEEEDDEIVVHQFDEGSFPANHEFEKARHPTGCVFILVFVDVVIPGDIFFVDRHHKTETQSTLHCSQLPDMDCSQCRIVILFWYQDLDN